MGWLFGYDTRQELIQSLIQAEENERIRSITLKHALRGNVLWVVMSVTAKQETVSLNVGETTSLIYCYLLCKDGEFWGYKSIMEAAGPLYYTCPLSYLDMAPVRSEGWRECVIAYHQSRRAQA